MKKSFFISFLVVICLFSNLTGETFTYKFAEGDAYRINSTVHERVSINRIFSHAAEITNRITVKVSDIQPAVGSKPASAKYDCTFMTSEKNSFATFSWGREYASVFRRDTLGNYSIDDTYFMPVVRNVPTFPERDLKPGDTWSGKGEEAHDLREKFALEKPYRVPFNVTYTYIGPVQKNGKQLHQIQAEYTMFFDSPQKPTVQSDYPVTTMGYSKQQIFWDNQSGLVPFYTEVFRIQLILASGTIYEFSGTADAIVTETKLMDQAQIVQDMNNEISRMGIAGTSAAATEEGVTISIENIQFEADSANLLPSEKEKIIKISALLERYPDNDLLISGHTALAGTAPARQKLSEERAAAVARFLTDNGVRNSYGIFTRGFGAEKPVAPNDSEENRARNRRVEITILDK